MDNFDVNRSGVFTQIQFKFLKRQLLVESWLPCFYLIFGVVMLALFAKIEQRIAGIGIGLLLVTMGIAGFWWNFHLYLPEFKGAKPVYLSGKVAKSYKLVNRLPYYCFRVPDRNIDLYAMKPNWDLLKEGQEYEMFVSPHSHWLLSWRLKQANSI